MCRTGVCAGATLIFRKIVLSGDSLKVLLATNREKHVYPKERGGLSGKDGLVADPPPH